MQESTFFDSTEYMAAASANESPSVDISNDLVTGASNSEMLLVALLLLLLATRPAAAFVVAVVCSVSLYARMCSVAIAHTSIAMCSKLTTNNAQSVLTTISVLATSALTTTTVVCLRYGVVLASTLVTAAVVWLAIGVMAVVDLTTACHRLISIPVHQKEVRVMGCIFFSVVLLACYHNICSGLQAVASMGYDHLLCALTLCCQSITSSTQAVISSLHFVVTICWQSIISSTWAITPSLLLITTLCCQTIISSLHSVLSSLHLFAISCHTLAHTTSAVPVPELALWMDYLVMATMLSLAWVSNLLFPFYHVCQAAVLSYMVRVNVLGLDGLHLNLVCIDSRMGSKNWCLA